MLSHSSHVAKIRIDTLRMLGMAGSLIVLESKYLWSSRRSFVQCLVRVVFFLDLMDDEAEMRQRRVLEFGSQAGLGGV